MNPTTLGLCVAGVTQPSAQQVVWPVDVQAFLALVDEVLHAREVPTVASALDKGRLTLILGELWDTAPHAARVEILRHEASHISHGCWRRRGERDPRLWNIATDAIIHGLNECDWRLMDKECHIESVTLERLGVELKRSLTLMPSERLYEHVKFNGCGSGRHSHSDDSLESRMRASQVGTSVLGAAKGSGEGFRGSPAIPPCPEGISQVLDWWLDRTVAREDR